tara:strand:+ start:26822 stop:27067 length:246 start_codon:yes stop_codon:yes gene_type:complete
MIDLRRTIVVVSYVAHKVCDSEGCDKYAAGSAADIFPPVMVCLLAWSEAEGSICRSSICEPMQTALWLSDHETIATKTIMI